MPFSGYLQGKAKYMKIGPLTHIEKESIKELGFPREPLALTPKEKEIRNRNIRRATKLGNNSKGKCRIIFHDGLGFKQVETTIWAMGEHHISLKYGYTIPIDRIAAVHIL